MICNKCNRKLPDDSEFCQYCGSKIESAEIAETFIPDTTELIEELNNPDITSDDVLSAILKFQAKATTDAMEANANTQPDNESDEDFGLVPEKPIFTLALKSVDGEEEYLDKLYTDTGEKITYTRRGSISVDGINGMIDIYDTFLPSGQPYKTIYINMYGAKASTASPKGFKLAASKTTTTKASRATFKKVIIASTIGLSAIALIVILLIPTVFIPSSNYKDACAKMNAGNYEEAIEIFEQLDAYKDAEKRITEAKYKYVLSHRNNDNLTTYEYLKDLKKQDYKDSNNIYNDLYKWRITGCINTEREYSSKHENSISKYCDSLSCNLKITGGTPGEKIDVTHTTIYPDGETFVSDWHWYDVADNHTFGVFWDDGIYEYPQNGAVGTFCIKIYNVNTGELIGTISTKIVN